MQLRTPACKPASTLTDLSSVAVIQDMNWRMMVFTAVVMGLTLESSPGGPGLEGEVSFTDVSSHFLDTCPAENISQCCGVITTQNRDELFPELLGRVSSSLSFEL